MQLSVISDTHFNLPDSTNRLKIPPSTLQTFLEWELGVSDIVVLLGDIFETWTGSSIVGKQRRFNRIKEKYPQFFQFLEQNIQTGRLIIISGNHDSIVYHRKMLPGTYKEYDIEDNGHRIHFEHGHEADFFNSTGRIFGRFITWLGGIIARLPFINSDMIWELFSGYLTPGRLLDPKAVRNYFMDKARRNGYNIVVVGHTHQEEIYRGDVTYGNAGCWVGKERYFPVLVIKDGDIRITYKDIKSS